MAEPSEPIRPFRWDLSGESRLGSLLRGAAVPNLWFADEVVACAARVLARSGDGDLHFVGRSMDSMFDLLTGALGTTSWKDRLHLLPLSLFGTDIGDLSAMEIRQLRAGLEADGLSPHALARRRRPAVFVDLVYEGGTFTTLYEVLRTWIAEERGQWEAIRRKLRFVGLTGRQKTSPNAWRWQQDVPWPKQLPSGAVVNVSMSRHVWGYLGDHQAKATASFRRQHWLDEDVTQPGREQQRRDGLAEAVALVKLGARRETREALAREMAREPTFAEPWLRSLALELRGRGR